MRTGMVKPLKTLPMINQMVTNRGFASEAMERSVQKLNKSLENEIKHEDEIYSQPEDIDHFLKESGFAFRETGEGVSMTLDKDYDNKHIEIVFEARQPMPDDMPEQEGMDEEELPSENYCDFTVFVQDHNAKGGLVVECTSMDTEISINNILSVDDLTAVKEMARFERSLGMYNGPDFSVLDERVQSAFTEYLENFGVNEHLALFVECMSLDKDHRLYMRWLSSVKEFINH